MSKTTPVEFLQNQRFCEALDPKLQHFLSKQPTVQLLEVGCGSGVLAFILQEKYKEKVHLSLFRPPSLPSLSSPSFPSLLLPSPSLIPLFSLSSPSLLSSLFSLLSSLFSLLFSSLSSLPFPFSPPSLALYTDYLQGCRSIKGGHRQSQGKRGTRSRGNITRGSTVS
jgi:hypothetical protein